MNESNNKSQRIEWIDNAKGIAILLVIIGHIGLWIQGRWNFRFVFGIHLVMFFLLAGYTSKKKELTAEFLSARFSKLMVPYFYTCLAIMITDIINSYLFAEKDIAVITSIIKTDLIRSFFASGAKTTFANIELNTRIGAIWFLPAMYFSIILFQLILHFICEDDFALGLVSAIISILGMISSRFFEVPFSIQSGMMAVFFLWIGYEIKKKELLSLIKWPHCILAIIVLVIGIKNNYCWSDFCGVSMADVIISLIVGLSGSTVLYFGAKNYKGRLLNWIGQNSLIILCFHLYSLETLGRYYDAILNRTPFEGDTRIYIRMIMEIVFAVFGAAIVIGIKKIKIRDILSQQLIYRNDDNSDTTITDVFKGIVVLSIMIKYFAIDEGLRNIICSYDFVALLFVEGIASSGVKGFIYGIKEGVTKYLVPYLFFVLGFVLINHKIFDSEMISNIWNGLFMCDPSAEIVFLRNIPLWPVNFLLLLFAVKILYTIIDFCISNEFIKMSVILLTSICGLYLSKITEFYIPFNADMVLYCLLYYAVGKSLKNVLYDRVINKNFLYFAIAPIWVYVIYIGGLNVETKHLEPYGYVFTGAMAAIVIIMMLADHIEKHIAILELILSNVGETICIVLVVYTLMNQMVLKLLSKYFDTNHFVCMVICITIQLLISMIIEIGIELGIKKIKKHNTSI